MIFDSNFECGNLDRVSIVSLYEYNLFLNVDTNTKGHSMWFYFAVTNTERSRTVKFNILNCSKPIPLFKAGMRPQVFSEISYEESGTEWIPDTSEAIYTRNNIPRNLPPGGIQPDPNSPPNFNTFYTLTFSYTFNHSGDRVYFAYSKPYSVTMHRSMLKRLHNQLIYEAKHIQNLQEDGLQKRIKEYVTDSMKNNSPSKDNDNKKTVSEEDQFANNSPYINKTKTGTFRKKNQPAVLPEANIAAADILKQYNETGTSKKFAWLKGQDFQIDTEKFIYRQETLCHTFSGFPIELITITAHPYFF